MPILPKYSASIPLKFLSILIVVLAQLTIELAAADKPARDLQRDPQALNVIRQALAPLGGEEVLAAIRSARLTGSEALIGEGEMAPAQFSWLNDFRKRPEFRSEFQEGNFKEVVVSGHGHPARQHGKGTTRMGSHVVDSTLPIHLPGIILARQLADGNYTIRMVGTEMINGTAVIHIHSSLDTDELHRLISPQDWFFDATTFLPLRLQCKAVDAYDAAQSELITIDYSDYQPISGVLVPFTFTESSPSNLVIKFTIETAEFNSPASPNDFEIGGAQ